MLGFNEGDMLFIIVSITLKLDVHQGTQFSEHM